MIPSSFTLFSTKWTIKHPAKITKEGLMGQCDQNNANILLRRNLKKDIKEATYHHELVHAILGTLGYTKLNEDEVFVERFGQALHQVLKTAEYEK